MFYNQVSYIFIIGGGIRKNEVDRQRSLNIERWLKDKFREGYLSMKTTFEKADEGHSGKVSFSLIES